MREENSDGVLAQVGNELLNDSKIDDPAAVRGGRKTTGVLVKFCGDFLIPDPTPEDPGRMRRSERATVELGAGPDYAGVVEFWGQLPNSDAEHTKVLFASLDHRGFVCHVPIIPMAGIQTSDPTHGIPPGDFEAVRQFYGFPSDDEPPYRDGRMTWPEVIARMDARAYKPTPPPSPPPPPEPPPITPEEQAERVLDVEAMQLEFGGMEMDAGQVESYLQGRSTPTEFHDQLQRRADGNHRPEYHRPGRPY